MSRIDMGAPVLAKEWCDLVEIVDNTLARAERLLAGHPVRTQFQSHLPLIQVDYVQLERVLHNLIENSVRHSPENPEIIFTIDSVAGQKVAVALPQPSQLFFPSHVIYPL